MQEQRGWAGEAGEKIGRVGARVLRREGAREGRKVTPVGGEGQLGISRIFHPGYPRLILGVMQEERVLQGGGAVEKHAGLGLGASTPRSRREANLEKRIRTSAPSLRTIAIETFRGRRSFGSRDAEFLN
ncbi:hypothetical protein KM043_006312 [Ampulex compressa]|nr:hypothetical protein KM043_006312 [Ampulex compressa]